MRSTAAVFLASLIFLGWGAGSAGIATAYLDPLAHVMAQDEAVYGASSLEMARHGGWITPRFLGRHALYKPPLLYWLEALSAKLLGPSALALRLPSILAGAATVALVFHCLGAAFPAEAALAGALLLLSSHLFFIPSRTGLTDALLTFEIALAMAALWHDPRLDSRSSRLVFGVATGAAIMTKAAAGLLPLVILAIAGISLIRLAQVSAIALAIALPWHLWQLYEHPRWFWAEYILGEHVTWGLSAPQQTTQESQLGFYAKRIVALDPVLLLAAVVGAVRTRRRLALSWIAVVLLTAVAWRYRNVTYLAPMLPAMAMLSATAIPKRYARLALAVATGVFLVKLSFPHAAWGLPVAPESVNPAQAALDAYATRHRGNDLIIVEPDDQFYAADLDLPRLRYLWLDPATNHPQLPLDFEYLGITVSASDYARLDQLLPIFRDRLRQWNLDSTGPVATVILARTPEEISGLIASNPQSDFYVSSSMTSPAHDSWRPSGTRVFLLSREVIQRP
ncbi:MAG TPA: glycosyltransferase family 39 protein [Bryobacteraceae bacterium]|nr:glycosyltransferase family 39 protein [Bryobacteraceae bacterium]